VKKGNMIFAKRVKSFREETCVSQEDLASNYGYTKQTVSSWENNGQIPRDPVLKSLATLFNTSTDYLLGFTDDPRSTNAKTQQPKDLLKLLDQEQQLMLNGEILFPEDLEVIKNAITQGYYLAKQLNKRSTDLVSENKYSAVGEKSYYHTDI